MEITRRNALAAAACGLVLAGGDARAADWPTGPVRVIVPFAAGGPTDLQARLVCQGLSQQLGQQFVVENRPGAGGNIGCVVAARAAPDGYTLLAGTVGTHAINEFLYARTGFDAQKDFTPLGMIASGPNVLIVYAKWDVTSVAELVARAKKAPGQLTYASAGAGTSNQLAMELFKSRAGIDVPAVSYRGAGPALNDVMAGQVPMMFNGIDNALPMIRSGLVRPLAISATARVPALPDVPTLIELGYPDFVTASWTAMFAPAATPTPIVDRLNTLLGETTNGGKIADTYHGLGLSTPVLSVPQMRDFIAKERVRWAEAVKVSGAKVD